jgi:hypothetical protein
MATENKGSQPEQTTESDRKVVAPVDGPEHGYIGYVPDETPNEDYTVAGVTGGTANVADKPKSTRTTKP